MGFEIFSRKVQLRGSPAVTFTKAGRIAINKTATMKFERDAVENVLLMWDEVRRIVGIRPITKKDSRAYKVRYAPKSNGSGFSAATFFTHIGYNFSETRTFPATWDDQETALIFEIPANHLQAERQQMMPVAIDMKKKA